MIQLNMKKNEMTQKSPNVPKNMQQKYDDIVGLTDKFSNEKLNDEYKELAMQMTAKLCRKRNSPLSSGTEKVWTCAIIHALEMVNFVESVIRLLLGFFQSMVLCRYSSNATRSARHRI